MFMEYGCTCVEVLFNSDVEGCLIVLPINYVILSKLIDSTSFLSYIWIS